MMRRSMARALLSGMAMTAVPAMARSFDVTVRNPIGLDRSAEMVAIDGATLGIAESPAWSAQADGKSLPTQIVDTDGDGRADTLLLSLDIGPRKTLHVQLDPVAAPALASPVQSIIGLRRGATFNGKKWVGGHIENVDRLDLDASHVAGDRLTLYDGPGWESDRIGFRIYLDQRNALDLFGKKQPAPVLQWIGRGVGDYHKEADWGMDILHVTDSLGAGGIGVIENGHVRQVGAATGGVRGQRIANGPVIAGAAVDDTGLTATAQSYDLHARYTIAAGTRITQVTAGASSATAPMVAGIEKRPNVTVLRSHGSGGWAYAGTYGQQSFIGDGLGMAILYRTDDAAEVGDDGHTVFVRFRDPTHIRYAAAAAWAKEGEGITDERDFARFLDRTIKALDHPLTVTVTPSS